jgi:sialidase-1
MRYLLLLAFSILAVLPASAQNSYIERYGNLDNVFYQVKVKQQANVVFLGGSITNMKGWRDKVCGYLSTTYPATRFNFTNAGIPSLGSLPHAFRFNNDVISKGRVDLLFVESAVNDKVNGTPPGIQQRALEGIVRHMLTVNPAANIVMMAFVDPDKMKDYRSGKVPAEVQLHNDIAKYYHLPFINLAKEVTDRIDAGEFTWEGDFKDLHPSPFGQELYFKSIQRLLAAEGNKPAPAKQVKVTLPSPIDPLSYVHAYYYNIHNAINKKGFSIDESWRPVDSIGTRPGFVHVPMLVSDGGEASLELPFTGRAVGIGIVSGPDAGYIRYSIDGQPMQELDLHTQWSKILYLPWYLLLADELKPEKHILRLKTGGPHQGLSKNVCRIVYFLVNE